MTLITRTCASVPSSSPPTTEPNNPSTNAGTFAGLRNIVMSLGRIVGPLVYGMLWNVSHVTFFVVLLAVGMAPVALLLLAWRPFSQVDQVDAQSEVSEAREGSYVSLGGGSGEERRSDRASLLQGGPSGKADEGAPHTPTHSIEV